MGTTPKIFRDRIRDIYGITDSASLQVSHDGGFLTNDIFVEKTDGEGIVLAVYCLLLLLELHFGGWENMNLL